MKRKSKKQQDLKSTEKIARKELKGALKEKRKQDLRIIIKEDLKALADEEYKKFHSSLCPGTENILGVRIPILRKYAKDLIKVTPNISYGDIDDEYYEEIMLSGMLIGITSNDDYIENTKKIEYFVPKIDNWAVCDIFVGGLKFIKKNPDKYWNFIKSYSEKAKEFEKRFAYVVMLNNYINDEYIDKVLNILINENSKDYYVYMSVAWALSICLIKYYEKTLEVMKSSNLNKIAYNKALQKACESYRICEEKKEELRKLKIK